MVRGILGRACGIGVMCTVRYEVVRMSNCQLVVEILFWRAGSLWCNESNDG